MLAWRRRSLATHNILLAEATTVVGATVDALPAIHTALDHFWQTLDSVISQPPDQVWRLQFTTAIAEIGSNIVRHAHRSGQIPGSIRLRLRLYDGRVEARFIDNGLCFLQPQDRRDASLDLATDEKMAADLPEGGYGMVIACNALDRLQYRRTSSGINCWRLVKRWS